jgi:hypothetical protein
MATVKATTPMRVVMTRQSFRDLDRSMPRVHSAIEARRGSGQPAAAG